MVGEGLRLAEPHPSVSAAPSHLPSKGRHWVRAPWVGAVKVGEGCLGSPV